MNLNDFNVGKGLFDHMKISTPLFVSSPHVEYQMFKKVTDLRHKFDGLLFCVNKFFSSTLKKNVMIFSKFLHQKKHSIDFYLR
jgi:hypothetical protein